jgi:hypothetical protein
MAQNNGLQLPKIGYLFHYPDPDHPSEKFRLDVFITSQHTEKHFDVLNANFPAQTPREIVTNLKVFHPWEFEQQYRVCPGLVILEDHKGKKEQALTFGGYLSIESRDLHTVCILVSQAPIIQFHQNQHPQELFIEEVEILLAEQRAHFHDDSFYQQRVCDSDPLELFQSCIQTLIHKLENFKNRNESYSELLNYLHTQEHRLDAAGLLNGPGKSLEEMFQNNLLSEPADD